MPRVFVGLVASASFLAVITGCGGGGSGGSSNSEELSPQPQSVSFDQRFVQAAEGELLGLTGQFSAPDFLELSQTPNIGLQVVSLQDDEIALRVPQVDRPSSSELELTFVYGDQRITQSISFLAQNTSADNLVQQVQDTVDEKNSILELRQDEALYHFFVDYAYLYGLLTYSEKERFLLEFSPQTSASSLATDMAIDRLVTDFTAYRKARISDQALAPSLSLAEAAILDHGRYGAQSLDNIRPLVEVLVPGMTAGELTYVPEAGFYSRFVSSAHYGLTSETGFVLAQAYKPVESLIRTRKFQSLLCESL